MSSELSKLKRLSGPEGAPLSFSLLKDMRLVEKMFETSVSSEEIENFAGAFSMSETSCEIFGKIVELAIKHGRHDLLSHMEAILASAGKDVSDFLLTKTWEGSSPLVSATLSGNPDTVAWVAKVLPSSVITSGELSLSGLVCSSPETARALVSSGVPVGDVKSMTLNLLSAVETRNVGMTKFWLASGADPFLEIREYLVSSSRQSKISVLEYAILEHHWSPLIAAFDDFFPSMPSKIRERLSGFSPSLKSFVEMKVLGVSSVSEKTSRSSV